MCDQIEHGQQLLIIAHTAPVQAHIELDAYLHVLPQFSGQHIVLGDALRCIEQPAQLFVRCETATPELAIEVVCRHHGHGLAQQHVRLWETLGYLVEEWLVEQHQAVAAGCFHHRAQQRQ